VTTVGWVGIGLLVAGGLAIAIEAIVAAVLGRAVAKRSQTLSERLESERLMLRSDLEKLQLAMQETERLWRPYRKLLRWLRHPLTIALFQSYARRRLVR
jgi:hypothetical protein